MSRRASKDPVIEAYKRDLDRSPIRLNLELCVEERILHAMELQKLAGEVRKAGARQRDRR